MNAPLADFQPPASSSPLDWALAYAKAGLEVFPVGADKKPLTAHGFKDATTNEVVIRAWWGTLWKHADIAWAVPPENVVSDLDVKGSKNGLRDFVTLEGVEPSAVETPMASTPTGGLHVIYSANGVSYKNAVSLNGSAIDLRTAGGYIVLPTPGNGREWLKPLSTPLAAAPAWLAPPPAPEPRQGEARAFSGVSTPYALAALEDACKRIVSAPYREQERTLNNECLGMGSLIAGGELDEAEAVARLIEAAHNMPAYREPWGDLSWKVRRAVADGKRKGPRNTPSTAIDPETKEEIEAMARPGGTASTTDGAPMGPQARGNIPDGVFRAVARLVDFAREAEAKSGSIISAASLAGIVPPTRYFIVDDLIPCRTVTMLGGDGGTGKSLLALQLAVAVAGGGRWLGREVFPGPSLYLSAEDELDEINRRLRAVASAEGLNIGDLGHLSIYPLAGEDALLAAPDRDGRLKPSVLWEALCKAVERLEPALVVLDTNADFYGGNEIDRAQVRQFVSLLRRLAMQADCAIVLLSHPSVSGMTSGSGLSGSTAWNNSVRSRLYFDRVRDVENREPDPDLRVLRLLKANYGPAGAEIRMKWTEGRFVAETPPAGHSRLAKRLTPIACSLIS